MPAALSRMKEWAGGIKRNIVALWLAGRDPRTPWYAKAAAAFVAAYALSPIDLIPDFIPILGYLDDLVLLPLGIMLVVRLMPPELLAEFRAEAARRVARPASRIGAAAVVLSWIMAAGFLIWLFWPEPVASAMRGP